MLIPGRLALPKGTVLAPVPMHSSRLSSAPPSLIDIQQMFNRGAFHHPSLIKVPSLMELNARASSPMGVRISPPAAAVARAVPVPVRVEVCHQPVARPVVTNANANATAELKQNNIQPAPAAPQPGVQCANCATTKTPLWRNGPAGPKTLCNACGVRFKLGKLPPPGGWPAGHVFPPPPPRKRPAHLLGETVVGKKAQKIEHDENERFESASRGFKKRRINDVPLPTDQYVKTHFGNNTILTDYDGAVLLMVLAGLYDH